jgi:precorrin isomerase
MKSMLLAYVSMEGVFSLVQVLGSRNKANCTELTSIVCVHSRGGETVAVAVLGGIARKSQQ